MKDQDQKVFIKEFFEFCAKSEANKIIREFLNYVSSVGDISDRETQYLFEMLEIFLKVNDNQTTKKKTKQVQ